MPMGVLDLLRLRPGRGRRQPFLERPHRLDIKGMRRDTQAAVARLLKHTPATASKQKLIAQRRQRA